MSELFPLPDELARVEYVQLYFHLEFCDYFDLPPGGLLRLRREIKQVVQSLALLESTADLKQLQQLLEPAVSSDPVLCKIAQRPAPGFVITDVGQQSGLFEPHQRLVLPVLLFAGSISASDLLRRLFVALGRQGISAGNGQFRLAAIEAENNSGQRAILWQDGEPENELSPPINDLAWWLSRQPAVGDQVGLEFLSPLRLLRQKKPLFKAKFAELFPFILRRVTAMLAYHAGVEPVTDPTGLIQLAGQVEVLANRLQWRDWRTLQGSETSQDLGGLLGSLQLRGSALAEIDWILQLGSLLNVGKGAAYGAGHYRLKTLP